MSALAKDLVILPPASARRCCYRCTAWQDWDTVAAINDQGGVIGREPVGQCRAQPPRIDPNAPGTTNAEWPVVNAADWCRLFGFNRREDEQP